MAKKPPCIIELDTRIVSKTLFPPTNDLLRSRIAADKIADDHLAGELRSRFPEGQLPGQMIELDAENAIGAIIEPMCVDPMLKAWATREAAKRGQRLPEERMVHHGVDVDEWAFWMRRLVDSAHARIVEGELPELAAINYRPAAHRYSAPTRPLDASQSAAV